MKRLPVFIPLLTCGLFLWPSRGYSQPTDLSFHRSESTPCDEGVRLRHRITDVVKVVGEQVPEMLGRANASLRLLACHGGNWTAVPFQIDEKSDDGRFLYPLGEENNRDEMDGELAGRDEIVFMAATAGDRVDPADRPKGLTAAAEIEITDPLTGEKGWCYLYSYLDEPPPLSNVDLIRYDPGSDRSRSRYYDVGYSRQKEKQKAVMESYSVPEEHGGDGVNFFDSAKIWVRIKLFFSLVKIVIHSPDFVSRVPAYIDGPVRVVIKKRTAVKIGMGLQTPNIDSDLIYYPHFFTSALVLAIPFDPSLFTSSMSISIGTDLNHRAAGMRFWNSRNPVPVLVDGTMSPEENRMDLGPDHWRVISGSQGKYLAKAVYAGNFKMSNIRLDEGRYIDDRTHREPPENEPGIFGSYNWTWDITHGRRGKYVVWIEAHYGGEVVGPQDVAACLNVTDRPLRIRVGPEERPNCLLIPPPGFTEEILPDRCRVHRRSSPNEEVFHEENL